MGLRSTARSAVHASRLLREPLYAAPGHYLSPISDAAGAERAESWRERPVLGIDLREDAQCRLVAALGLRHPEGPRWRPNGMYGALDAAFLQAMLRHHDIGRVLEIGSGWSTVAMLDARPDVRLTCVEPNPERLLDALGEDRDRVELHATGVQGTDPALVADLEAGDLLFIDSTHVVKAGSDVVWLMLHLLPTLAPGVRVHIHDIHWPFEYPAEWLRQRRDWTEAYLVRAFLAHNSAWEIELMTSWIAEEHPELLPPDLRGHPTGSLWIRRVD